MSLLHAFVLGLVQGVTEFLPVSSSGHLTLVPFIMGWSEPTLAFGVAVHVGTLIALGIVFKDEVTMVLSTVRGWSAATADEQALVRLLAIATIPAVVVGVVFESVAEDAFASPVIVSFLLGVTGYWLLSSETRAERHEEPPRAGTTIGTKDAVVMGIAQATAILPGISRSGATIGVGLRLGLSRPAAARFSFLMAIPVVAGAMIVQLPSMVSEGLSGSGPAMILGIITSAVSGTLAIRWFLDVIARTSLRAFGTYASLAMIAGLLTALARG